jgi:hypothetical protein
LFYFLRLDAVRPNLVEIVLIPIELYQSLLYMQCIDKGQKLGRR